MATAWAHANVLEQGPNYVKNNATRMLLINAYTFADSYATVTNGTNILATATMASGDYTLEASGNNRRMVTAAKSGLTAGNSGSGDLHIAFTNGTDTVYWVTDAGNQTVTSGNTVNIPAITYTANQPTLV